MESRERTAAVSVRVDIPDYATAPSAVVVTRFVPPGEAEAYGKKSALGDS
jgi:hypothetical protein